MINKAINSLLRFEYINQFTLTAVFLLAVFFNVSIVNASLPEIDMIDFDGDGIISSTDSHFSFYYSSYEENYIAIVPEGVVTIGQFSSLAGQNMVGLKLPKSLEKLDTASLQECKNLEFIEFYCDVAPSLGKNVFMGTGSNVGGTKVYINQNATGFSGSSWTGLDNLTIIRVDYDLSPDPDPDPDPGTDIPNIIIHDIDGNGWLEMQECYLSIYNSPYVGRFVAVVPDGVESLRDNAFDSSMFHNRVVGVKLPDSISEIGSYAFRYCYLLESIEYYGDVAPSASNNSFALTGSHVGGVKFYVNQNAIGYDVNYPWINPNLSNVTIIMVDPDLLDPDPDPGTDPDIDPDTDPGSTPDPDIEPPDPGEPTPPIIIDIDFESIEEALQHVLLNQGLVIDSVNASNYQIKNAVNEQSYYNKLFLSNLGKDIKGSLSSVESSVDDVGETLLGSLDNVFQSLEILNKQLYTVKLIMYVFLIYGIYRSLDRIFGGWFFGGV